jgi:hypothetical protein
MAKVKDKAPSNQSKKSRPALDPEARQNQLIALAVDCAEQQLRDGTASAQIIAYFLKQGSEQAKLEIERLTEENKLLRAKTEAIESEKRSVELVEEALKAFRNYSGHGDPDEYEY